MSMRVSVGVSMEPDEVEEIDQRTGDESRSEYIRRAVRARFDAEDAGEWPPADLSDQPTGEAQATN